MTKQIPQYCPVHNRKLLKKMMNEYLSGDGWITEHKITAELESKIAEFLGVKYCSMVSNGTISLSLALLAHGVKSGDSVLIPALSMIATANAVAIIGANPIFVDVDDSLCMSYQDMVAHNEIYNAKAVMFVSLNGRSGDHNRISKYCKAKNIAFIEDAAQSFGSATTNAKIKSYSFSMPKIISMGQGGCLVTNDKNLARIIKHLKDFGRESGGNDCHDYFGINSKITELQSIVGLEQISTIKWRTQRKREIYKLYADELNEIVELIDTDLNKVVPWFVDIYVDDRDDLAKFLKCCGIGTRAVYPPMYLQKIYNLKKVCQNTEHYSSRGLWLPSSLNITDAQIKHICNKIKEYYDFE